MESLNIPNLPIGEFLNIRATWDVNGTLITSEFPFHIRVLGIIATADIMFLLKRNVQAVVIRMYI